MSGDLRGDLVRLRARHDADVSVLDTELRPAFRGKGLATDTVRVLCNYGRTVLGLHRIQLETAADNHPMTRAAERAGCTKEGVLRDTGWVLGKFVGEAVFGILADEWSTA
jgi:RimJ/RimL family protein N-acetyltransferase